MKWIHNYNTYTQGDLFDNLDDYFKLKCFQIEVNDNINYFRKVIWKNKLWYSSQYNGSDTLCLYDLYTYKQGAWSKFNKCRPIYRILKNKEKISM